MNGRFLFVLAFLLFNGCKESQPAAGSGNGRATATPYPTNYIPPPSSYYVPPSYYPPPSSYGGRITYVANIGPVIQSRCVSCHNSSNMGGNVNLQMYVQDPNLWSRVVYDVQSGRMPKGSPLTPDVVSQFTMWQQANYPYQ